jgi:pimeloyl-ACP methyl ester carboxylesterase
MPALTLTHRVDGDGPPLILLNGGLMSIAAWDALIPDLSQRWRVVRCDFRGQLRTGGPFPRSLDEHAQDVIDLMDLLGIETAHWLGVSFGAEVAMVAAALHGHRVQQLTVITATERTDERMRREAAEGRALAEQAAAGGEGGAELFRQIFTQTWSDQWLARQPADFLESRLRQIAALPPEFFAGSAAILAVLDDLDLTSILGRITAPTLVIGGAEDRMFPPEHSRAIARLIPGARLEIVESTGHGLLFERADRVLALLA